MPGRWPLLGILGGGHFFLGQFHPASCRHTIAKMWLDHIEGAMWTIGIQDVPRHWVTDQIGKPTVWQDRAEAWQAARPAKRGRPELSELFPAIAIEMAQAPIIPSVLGNIYQ